MAKLGPVYKGDAGKVAAALAKVPAQEVADAMQKDGNYMAGNYQVFTEQVTLANKKPLSAANALFHMWLNPVSAQTGYST